MQVITYLSMIETLTMELDAGMFKFGAAFGAARNSEDTMAKGFG